MKEQRTWDKCSKSELLSLPKRDWNKESYYDAVLFIPTKEKHDSGYNLFAIVGCQEDYPKEIAGYMDDFRLSMFEREFIWCSDLAFDCSMAGVFRMHVPQNKRIWVGTNTSTTFWKLITL